MTLRVLALELVDWATDSFVSNLELVDLKQIIEDELFTLSDAHYQRYFALEENYRV